MENKTNNQCKTLEDFLRRNFGLNGEYHSEAYKRAEAIEDEAERDDAYKAILEAKGPEGYYTEEAWEAWDRALAMVDDLVAMGILADDGIYSPADNIRTGFCDLSN